MNIDVRDKVTLDNGEVYVVAGKINYQNKMYYYLIEATKHDSLKICYEKTGTSKLVESEDKEVNAALIPLFAEQLKPFLDLNNN